MPIATTLAQTKAATYAVLVPNPNPLLQGMPTPHGTAFFVSDQGHLVTARHVIDGQDLTQMILQKEPQFPPSVMFRSPTLVFEDAQLDLALLRVDVSAAGGNVSCLTVSTRVLEEGEDVYAFGYPLSSSMLLNESTRPVGQSTGPIVVGAMNFVTRTTSAVVSAHRESFGAQIASFDPQVYVLDKALNYGNSGGPIISTSTGHVHAVCSRFQPLLVPQPLQLNLRAIMIPSLYGIVSRVSDPRFITVLQANGVPIVDV